MKRRDFMKHMALAGAGSIAAMPSAASALYRQAIPLDSERNTQVFISDLHMNLQRRYSWLVTHAKYLADFLENLNDRSDVSDLIIVGDMLDDWVRPVDLIPQTFDEILNANVANGIVPALQKICENPNINVTYVAGNHDMLSFLAENKQVVEGYLPNITILSDSPGLGVYTRDDVIWAEHGHRYTLFNAPDVWSRNQGHLPLGYFITRLDATKSLKDDWVYTTPEVLDVAFNSPDSVMQYLLPGGYEETVGGVIDDALIVAIFNGIALWSGEGPFSEFSMNSLDGFSTNPRVEDIAFTYDSIFSKWPERQNIVDHYLAVYSDLGHLGGAANLLFEMPDRIRELYPFRPRIVLFGHTHEAAFRFHSGDAETIYINTGTWIDKKPDMTWAEIEKTQDERQVHYKASLWYYGDSTPRHEGTISVER